VADRAPAARAFIVDWQITLNGAAVPLWLRGLVAVAVAAAGLAVMVWRERPR
jgi:hypothetical protein